MSALFTADLCTNEGLCLYYHRTVPFELVTAIPLLGHQGKDSSCGLGRSGFRERFPKLFELVYHHHESRGNSRIQKSCFSAKRLLLFHCFLKMSRYSKQLMLTERWSSRLTDSSWVKAESNSRKSVILHFCLLVCFGCS